MALETAIYLINAGETEGLALFRRTLRDRGLTILNLKWLPLLESDLSVFFGQLPPACRQVGLRQWLGKTGEVGLVAGENALTRLADCANGQTCGVPILCSRTAADRERVRQLFGL